MLRAAGLHKELKDLNWAVNDVGDLKFAPPKPDDPAMDEKERGAMRFGYAVGNGCKQVRTHAQTRTRTRQVSLYA
eukprot:3315635-Rhodomonas_salina.1